MLTDNLTKNRVNREKLFEDVLNEYYHKGQRYDYLVLFSAGKDSTYLANQIKKVKGNRACLFTVDNGFGEEYFADHVKKVAKEIGLDHYIVKPPAQDFEKLFNLVIKEPGFREVDRNPICFFCGCFMTSLGIQFAKNNNIPVVVHGMSPTQYNLQFDVNFAEVNDKFFVKSIAFLEKFRFKKLNHIYNAVKILAGYKNDPVIKKVMDSIFNFPDDVRILIPFLYLEYNVEKIKKVIEDELGWKNMFNINNNFYISAGCRLFDIFLLMEKKIPGFKVHERDEFEKDYNNGVVSEEAYNYITNLVNNFENNTKITPDMEDLIRRIGLEEELLNN